MMEIISDVWQVALTAICSVIALFLLAKLIGHRQIAQLGVFDYINGITIGSIAAEMATELESPWKPLTALIIYSLAAWGLSLIMNKFPRSRKYINGTPTIIFDNGRLYRENMKKSKLDLTEFLCMCRHAGYFDLGDIQTAVFEHNGTLSVLPVANRRPATPEDLQLSPAPARIMTEIIMDGRILGKTLPRVGWMKNGLSKTCVHRATAVPKAFFRRLRFQSQSRSLLLPWRKIRPADQNIWQVIFMIFLAAEKAPVAKTAHGQA